MTNREKKKLELIACPRKLLLDQKLDSGFYQTERLEFINTEVKGMR